MRPVWTIALYATAFFLSLFTFSEFNRHNKAEYMRHEEELFERMVSETQSKADIYYDLARSLYAFKASSEKISENEIKTFFQTWRENRIEKGSDYVAYYGWMDASSSGSNFTFLPDGTKIRNTREYYSPDTLSSFTMELPDSGMHIVVAIERQKFMDSLAAYIKTFTPRITISDAAQKRHPLMEQKVLLGNTIVTLSYDRSDWTLFHRENYSAFFSALAIFLTISYVISAYAHSKRKADYYEREKTEFLRELDEKNYFLNEMIENLPGIVFVKDAANGYAFHTINKAAEDFFGYTRENMIGKTDYDFFREEEADFFRQVDESIMKGGKKVDIPCESVTTKQGEMLCHTRKVPVYDTDGTPKFLIGLTEDITKRKKNELELADYRENLEKMVDERTERLKQAMAKAEESNRLKSEFLATMSHEIRSPMSGVLGMAELLLDTPLSPEQKSLTKTILNSGEILMNIIEDILDFSKIEANKLELDPVPVNMLEIVDDVGLLYFSKARDKALELAIRYVPGTEQFVYADPVRVKQILGNIVNNAIKFTDRGHIIVLVREEKTDGNDNDIVTLHFSVEDSGIGIDQEDHEKIFGKFAQANSSTTRQYGGTGLGLSICKNLVELMGGTISFTSEKGKGSTFGFSLPLKRNKDEFNTAKPPASLKNTRVLVVDDLEIVRQTLIEQLEGAGMVCTAVATARETLLHLKEAAEQKIPYDIVIIDYLIPDMNGEILARAIKADTALNDTCLVMLTAAGTPVPMVQNAQSDFSAFLSKPIRTMQLLETLSYVWEQYRQGAKNSVIRIDSQTLQTVPQERDYTVEGARVLLVEDSRLNQAFAEEVLAQIHCDVTLAANGKEALKLLESGKFDLVLMDCQMPVMDGFEASKTIMKMKQDGLLDRSMPVIALTANAMKGDRQKCLESGMDDYISKPVRKNELKEKIYHWINHRNTAGGLRPLPDIEETVPESYPVLDLGIFEEARSILKEKFDFMMGCYLEDVATYILEMQDATSRKDMNAIILPAHTIKSTSKRMGALYLSEIAKTIEMAAKEAANNNDPDRALGEKITEDLKDLALIFEQTREALTAGKAR